MYVKSGTGIAAIAETVFAFDLVISEGTIHKSATKPKANLRTVVLYYVVLQYQVPDYSDGDSVHPKF